MSLSELQEEIVNGRPVVVWVIGAVWDGSPQTYTTTIGKQVTVAPFEHTMLMSGYSPDSVSLINAGTGEMGVYPLRDFLTSWKVLGNMAVTAYGKIDPARPQGSTPTLPVLQTPQVTPQASAELPVGFMTMTPMDPGLNFTPIPIMTAIPDLTPFPTLGLSILTGTALPLGTDMVASTYVVQEGDTLSSLAASWNLNWQDLALLNNLQSPFLLYAGQILKLPNSIRFSPTNPELTPAITGIPIGTPVPPGSVDLITPQNSVNPQSTATFIPITPVENISQVPPATMSAVMATELPTNGTYIVQPGDYLARLAREWGVSWQDVAQLNAIPFPFQLETGQLLKIPIKR